MAGPVAKWSAWQMPPAVGQACPAVGPGPAQAGGKGIRDGFPGLTETHSRDELTPVPRQEGSRGAARLLMRSLGPVLGPKAAESLSRSHPLRPRPRSPLLSSEGGSARPPWGWGPGAPTAQHPSSPGAPGAPEGLPDPGLVVVAEQVSGPICQVGEWEGDIEGPAELRGPCPAPSHPCGELRGPRPGKGCTGWLRAGLQRLEGREGRQPLLLGSSPRTTTFCCSCWGGGGGGG